MANLKPLIRVRKHAIEQKQKYLAGLYREAEEHERQKQKLIDEFAHERKTIQEMGADMLGFFGAYSKAVEKKREQIDAAITKLETRIVIAQDDMRQAYADLRRIEIVQEKRDRDAAQALAKKESQELDEIGITRFLAQAEEAR
jgi:flagellar FliJ protein